MTMTNKELFFAMVEDRNVFMIWEGNVLEVLVKSVGIKNTMIYSNKFPIQYFDINGRFFKIPEEAEASLLPEMPDCLDCGGETHIEHNVGEFTCYVQCSADIGHTTGKACGSAKEAIETYSRLFYQIRRTNK